MKKRKMDSIAQALYDGFNSVPRSPEQTMSTKPNTIHAPEHWDRWRNLLPHLPFALWCSIRLAVWDTPNRFRSWLAARRRARVLERAAQLPVAVNNLLVQVEKLEGWIDYRRKANEKTGQAATEFRADCDNSIRYLRKFRERFARFDDNNSTPGVS